MAYVLLVIIIIFSGAVLLICKDRNAWDILFYNTLIGILALLEIGIIANDIEVWLRIISFIGVVATGSAIVSGFFRNKE